MADSSILIEMKVIDKATKKIKSTENAISNLGKKVKMSSVSQTKSLEDVTDTLDSLGNRFRYLSLVAGMAAGAMTLMVKKFVSDAMELEQAQMKVGAFARISGQSFERANEVAEKFARQGIMSVTEAYNTLSNLLATGMNIDKAEELMQGAQDMAVLAKESITDTTGKAMEKFSLGIRIMQERMVDAVGVNFVARTVWKAYGDELGKTTDQMSSTEKQQAMVNYVMKEFVKVEGASEIAASTFTGTINRLRANVQQMSAALGRTLMPVIGPLAEEFIKAADGLRRFAKEMPEVSMVAISGSLAVTLLITGLATAGALLPMVAKGAQFTAGALKMLSVTAVVTSLKFIALAVAIGALIYLVAKATGQWDKFSNAMKNMQKRLAGTLKTAKKTNEEIADPKVAKKLKKIQDQMALTTRSFKEGMREWVDKHDKTIKDLTKQINDLEREYTKALNKINDNFKDTQEDEALSHRRKVEDIQREIDEEVSKGLWADQTKIRNLERELARENEDYSIAQQRNEDRREEDLEDTENKYSERLAKLKEELEKEEVLEREHADLIAKYRTWPLIDYINKQERQYRERMAQLREQMSEMKGNASTQNALNEGLEASFGGIGDAIDDLTAKADEFGTSAKISIRGLIGDNTELIAKLAVVATAIMGIITAVALLKAAFGSLLAIRIGLWFLALEGTAIGALGGIGLAVGTLSAALASIPMLITITVTLGGFALAMSQIASLKNEIGAIDNSMQNLADAQMKYLDNLKKKRDEGKISAEEYSRKVKELQENAQDATTAVHELNQSFDPSTFISSGIVGISNMLGQFNPFDNLFGGFFQHGGIVPGSSNQAVPIIAHGGETVVPAGESPITVNINNPTVRRDSDITRLANQIEEILSRRSFLRRFK